MHVAQMNVGTMIAPTDDPRVAEFMDALERVNAIADRAPGFVWRLQTGEGNATAIHLFPNPLKLVNMSVWESIETLRAYVYRGEHVEFFRRRHAWFEHGESAVALWYVEPGTIPGLDEAVRRVAFVERHGPSPYAFGFAHAPEPLTFEIRPAIDPEVGALLARLGSPIDTAAGDDVVVARLGGDLVGAARGDTVDVTDDARALLIDRALTDQVALAADRTG